MYFIVFWFKKNVFYCFLCIVLFYDFCCFRSSFGSVLRLNKWYTKQKEWKITDLQAKIKNSLCHLFCTQNEKNLTFRVDLWSQKVMWLRNGKSDFANLVSKYPQDFKENTHEVARLKARWFCVRGKICRGGPPRPPPPQCS